MGRELDEHVETLVIGGSQAGLAMAHELSARGRPVLVLDAHDRVGDAWRERWDSLRLFTPARYCGLPGMPFPGPRAHYPTKDEAADYLEAYAARFDLPVRTGVRVHRLEREGERFVARAADRAYTADQVVLATGMYGSPRIPELARSVDPGITQLHSRDYRNPGQLRPGGVLVVGAGNSGSEIALEVAGTHPTCLAGRDVGEEPTRAGTWPDRLILPLMWLMASRVLSVDNPLGRKARDHFLHPPRGIPLGRARARDLAEAGVERVPRVTGVRDGAPLAEDGRALPARTVIWCTGFDPDLSWVDLRLTLRDGHPEQDHGVVREEPGLYVIGWAFQRSLSSALLGGVGRDAAGLADVIVAGTRSTLRGSSPPRAHTG
jgi:putative flavoprotein involved in K+ transport